MIGFSLTTFLRHEFRRLVERSTNPASLDETEAVQTIGDCIETYDLDSRFPDGWCVERDIVQFSGDSLAEVVALTHSGDGFRITLKPVEMEAPTERVEIYRRPSPFESRQRHTTADSLSAAVAAAERIATRREQREQRQTAVTRREGTDRNRVGSA